MYQNSGNILVVSGEEHELNMFRSEFVRHYNIFTAQSVQKGHQILKDYDIHVVLVRQRMPEMTGLQFCEGIAHSHPDLIKIVLTGENDSESLHRAVESDLIYRYVVYPYTEDELKMTLDGALKLSEARYQNRELSSRVDKYEKEQDNILRLFKRYVPAEVVSQALRSEEDQLMRPGENRVVSVLFTDIRGFTQIASHLRPTQVVDFLNDYWAEISDCVRENKGSVNKYIGDGLLAVFGAPVSYMDNHENAISAALDMVERLDVINRRYAGLLGTEIQIGIGINSGEVIVGNVGTDSYMEYTVIGDTVNIASRMESISKQKPNSIIISDRTYELVKDSFTFSEAKEATVKGEQEKASYREVLGRKSNNIYNIRPSQENG